jgi:adhesin/invasin
LALVGITCGDLATAPGIRADVRLVYTGPGAPSRNVQLIVGDSIVLPFDVFLGQTRQPRARYAYTSTNPSIIRVSKNGDSVYVMDRGVDTLVASVVGATIGSDQTAAIVESLFVVAKPFVNRIRPDTTVAFTSIGETLDLDAVSLPRDTMAAPLTGVNIAWSSSNPAVISVDPATGLATALSNGFADITALFEGVDAVTKRITVSQTLSRFRISSPRFGPNATLTFRALTDTVTVTATPLDSRDAVMSPPSVPTFSIEQTSRATVATTGPFTGVVTAVSNTDPTNPTRLCATNGGITSCVDVVVDQRAATLVIQGPPSVALPSIGAQRDLIAVARDSLTQGIRPEDILWTSLDQDVAQVVGGSPARVTAIGIGSTSIIASYPNRADTVAMTVTNDPDTVSVTPEQIGILSLEDTVAASAVVRNANRDVLGVTVNWRSLNAAIAEVLADGRVVGKAVGSTFVIGETVNAKADTSAVVVTNHPDLVDILPTAVTLASVGDTLPPIGFDFRNGRGVALPRSSVIWSSANESVARTSADGQGTIVAVGAGETFVKAVSPGNPARRDSVFVTVTNAATSVTITPAFPPALTSLGSTIQFTSTVFNAAGDPIGNGDVRWSVPVGGSSLSIDPISGLATALTSGSATVRATIGTIVQDVSVTVAQTISPSASTMIPASPTLVADGSSSTTITVQLKDANGNDIATGGASVLLTTSLGTLSGVADQGAGRYTATLTAGTTSGAATVSGTVNSVALGNSALVSLTSAAAAQYLINVSPNLAPIAGASVTISAQIADVNGNPLSTSGDVVTWGSTGGGSFSAPTSTTTNGVATVTFTTNTTSGIGHTVTATTAGITGTSAAITTQPGAATNYLVTPTTLSPSAGSGVVVNAQLRDATANPVALAGQVVSWSKSDPNGALSAASSTTNAAGVATITLITHTVSGTTTTVTATTGANTGTTAVISTVPGAVSAAATLITSSAASVTAGGTTTITVQARDANGNNLLSSAGTVMLTTTLGSLGAVTDNANGSYSAMLTTSAAGTATITGTIGGVAIGDNEVVTVSVGSASGATTLITPAAASIVADGVTTTSIGIQAKDSQGNNLQLSGGAVVLNATAGSLSAVTDNGNGTYVATLTAAATTATATVSGTIGGAPITDNGVVSFVAGPASAATSTITTLPPSPASVTVGSAVTITVQLRDANNNALTASGGTVVISRTGTGSLTATTDNGNGSYTATINSGVAGSATISAMVNGSAITAGTATVSFSAGTATQIAVNAGNTQFATAGSAVPTPPSVIVRDANGNPVSGVNVTFAIAGGGGSISAPATVATDALGVAALGFWTLGTVAGPNALTATAAGLTGSPVNFTATGTIGAASTATSTISSSSGSIASGGAAGITVTLRDANSNPLVGSGGSVALAVNIGSLSAVTDAGNGTYTATYTGTTAGTATITGTINGATIADNAVTTVTAGTATQIAVDAGAGQSAAAGTPVATPPSVIVRDASNNPVQGVSIEFEVTAGGGIIAPGSIATIATGPDGVAALASWQLGNTAGTNTVSVNAPSNVLTGEPITFNATGAAGAATQLFIATEPSTTATSGSAFAPQPVVEVRDALGNVRTNDNSTVVTATRLGGAGTLQGTLTATAVNGVATFSNLRHDLAPTTISIQFSAGGLTSATSVNVDVDVAAASATTTTISASPTTVVADGASTSTITVQARDAQGNNRITESDAVTLTANPGGALAVAAGPAGSGTYTATLPASSTSGLVTITGTINTIAISDNATVMREAATATQYLVTRATPSVVANTNVLITAQLADANGNPVLTSGKTVVWSSSNGGSFATPTSLTDANGQAVVAFRVGTTAGTVHAATATDNTALDGTSAGITVIHAAATQLVFQTQPPASTEAGAVMAASVVEVRDAFGNPVITDPNGAVTERISIALTTPAGATLGGTTQLDVDWLTGRATFSDLTVDLPNTYTLSASDVNFTPGLTDATSASFTIPVTTAGLTSVALTESSLDGAVLTVTLTNGTYDAVLNGSDFSLAGAPAVTAIASVNRISATVAEVTLSFDLSDFDVSQALSVDVLAAALTSGTAATTNSVAIAPNAAVSSALTGAASAEASAITAVALEAREANGTTMIVTTSEAFALSSSSGTAQFWANSDGTGAISSATIANGTSSITFYHQDATTGAATITADDDADVVEGAALGAPTLGHTILTPSASVTATNPNPLVESTLSGATLTVTLTNATYAGAIDETNFSLTAPAGVTIASVSRTSNNEAVITLAFAGDFVGVQTIAVNVLQSALASGLAITTPTVNVDGDQ